MKRVSVDNSPKNGRRRILVQALAGLGVLALALLLLGWGLSATQWTILSTNNNLADAVNNGLFYPPVTRSYSIPQGVERDIVVGLYFQLSSQGSSGGYDNYSSVFYGLVAPISNTTTTIQYYALFSFTYPNSSAVNVWFTGPRGNITQSCGSLTRLSCLYYPIPVGAYAGIQPIFFQTPTAGNYTMHLLGVACSSTPNSCTSNTATIRVSRALSLVTYNRPYYNTGLATEIAASIATAAAVAYLAITAIRTLQKRTRGTRPPSAAPPIIND